MMTELTNAYMTENCERHIPNPAIPKWSQSYYFNFYDRNAKLGGFIRFGFMENMGETNGFAIFFKDGKPLFTRLNMHLPYTSDRPEGGVTVAGVRLEAVQPLQACRITIDTEDFGVDLVWNQRFAMGDSIVPSEGSDDAIARELAFIHLEGACDVTGTVRVRGGEIIEIDDAGFRDISCGPRNWAGVQHYRLAWPIFDNGMSCVAVHAITEHGDSYQKILHDGERWHHIGKVEEVIDYEADEMGFRHVHWKVWDEDDRLWEFTAKPLFRWQFPFDTFVMVEQMMEYRLSDGTIGYGMGEGGFRFPWEGNGN
ncbi:MULTISPECIES: DUF7064 domain-containing protein [Sphingobium]|jgi:hypothetical protein|nr:hypothetical protein [Sphingobium lactosutens]